MYNKLVYYTYYYWIVFIAMKKPQVLQTPGATCDLSVTLLKLSILSERFRSDYASQRSSTVVACTS